MFAWEAMEKALDAIEMHLFEPLGAQQIAESVGLSAFYFQRLFKRLTGRTLQEYVKLRRLACSVDLLQDSCKTILEVALDCGFSSHANYTRAFRACFGLTPQAYRRMRPDLNVYLRPDLFLRYGCGAAEWVVAEHMVLETSIRALVQPEFFQGYEVCVPTANHLPAGEATGVDLPGELWRRLHARREQCAQLFAGTVELGVCHSAGKHSFIYFAGAQVPNQPTETADLVDFILEPGEYAVCRIEAPSHAELVNQGLYNATRYMYDVYLSAAKRTPSSFAAEKYHLPDQDVCCMELWIPLLPKER